MRLVLKLFLGFFLITGIAAFFGLSNRMANVTNMRPNAEFYSLGR